jgi:hypothetical protein
MPSNDVHLMLTTHCGSSCSFPRPACSPLTSSFRSGTRRVDLLGAHIPCTAGDDQLLRVQPTAARSASRDTHTCSPAIGSSATDTGYRFKCRMQCFIVSCPCGVHAGS